MTNKQETNTTDVEKAFEEWFEKNPFDPWVTRLPFEAGFIAGARSRGEEVEQLREENKKLRFMIDNGLGWEDLKNDVSYPNG